ncbi:hypothetical protein OROMI_029901 [Orobanche minor]
MWTVPRILLSLLNVGILIFGVYQIVYADNLSESSSLNSCLRQSVSSFQWIGIVCSVVAGVGIIGTFFQLKALQCIYLLAVLVWTVSSILYCVFVSSMMPRVPAEWVFYNTAEHGVWLPEYGTLMQKIIANERDFSAAKECLQKIDTCQTMINQTEDQKVVYIFWGCCNPPNRCGLQQASMGRWVEPPHGLNSTDDECLYWASHNKNCFETESCKAGYLGNYQHDWETSMNSRIQGIIVLVVTSALSYYTFIYDKDDPIKHGKLLSTNV